MTLTVSLSKNDWSLHRKGPIDQARHNEKVKEAGQEPGVDYYEAEITVEELAALVFADLGLPFLKPKGRQEIESETVRFNEIRKRGIMSNLDKKRTIGENLRRNARLGQPGFYGLSNDDLR